MKQLIEDIAKALVDIPEEVAVRVVEGEQVTVLELRVAHSDLGKVIGKQGRTARSIRTILGAAGMKLNRRFTLEILELVSRKTASWLPSPGWEGPGENAASWPRSPLPASRNDFSSCAKFSCSVKMCP
jgi:predicted RNA-binding protein YlqC (UPF0109 family)